MSEEIVIRKLLSEANPQYVMYAFTADPRTRIQAETILRNMELDFGMAGTGASKAKTKSVNVDAEGDLAAKVAQMVLESLGQNKPQNNRSEEHTSELQSRFGT